jgi:DNA ligase-1
MKGKMGGGDPYLGCQWGSQEDHDLVDRLADRRLTGNAAKAALEDWGQVSSVEDIDLLNRVLNKDIKCGVGVKLLNEVGAAVDFKIPVFEVALCHPATEKLISKGDWIAAIKYDGMRALIQVRDNAVTFFTRSGKLIPALDHLAKPVLEIFGGRSVMLDSEAISGGFQESMSTLRRSKNIAASGDEVLQVFDMVDLHRFLAADRKQEFGGPLENRLLELDHVFGMSDANEERGPVRRTEHEEVRDWAHARELFDGAIDEEEEGIILRRLDAGYRKDRTNSWLKLKLEDTVDASIEGLYEGEGEIAGMMGGAFVTINGVRCRVGGGWSLAERAEAWAAYTGEAVGYRFNGVDYVAEYDEECSLVDRIIEIKFNGYTDDGALRHGRKKRFRDIEGEKA